jgi:hypothetical protein
VFFTADGGPQSGTPKLFALFKFEICVFASGLGYLFELRNVVVGERLFDHLSAVHWVALKSLSNGFVAQLTRAFEMVFRFTTIVSVF